ncbi:MAG: hypothetical protein WAM11_03245 [Cyanobium sp.]
MVRNVCCIGAGCVGGPSMAVMADFCLGVDIHVVDVDQQHIDGWNNLNNQPLPVYEKSLLAISIHDPRIAAEDINQLLNQDPPGRQGTGCFDIANSALSDCNSADAMLIFSDWPEHREPDWALIAAQSIPQAGEMKLLHFFSGAGLAAVETTR